jgi:hypothetical protein
MLVVSGCGKTKCVWLNQKATSLDNAKRRISVLVGKRYMHAAREATPGSLFPFKGAKVFTDAHKQCV